MFTVSAAVNPFRSRLNFLEIILLLSLLRLQALQLGLRDETVGEER